MLLKRQGNENKSSWMARSMRVQLPCFCLCAVAGDSLMCRLSMEGAQNSLWIGSACWYLCASHLCSVPLLLKSDKQLKRDAGCLAQQK